MTFPITCNSFGDIVTAISLVCKVLDALRGSAGEYKSLVQELDSLAEIILLGHRVATNIQDEWLRDLILKRVQLCFQTIRTIFERTIKYKALGHIPSSSSAPSLPQYNLLSQLQLGKLKLEWRARMRDEARQYAEEVHRLSGQLQLAMSLNDRSDLLRLIAGIDLLYSVLQTNQSELASIREEISALKSLHPPSQRGFQSASDLSVPLRYAEDAVQTISVDSASTFSSRSGSSLFYDVLPTIDALGAIVTNYSTQSLASGSSASVVFFDALESLGDMIRGDVSISTGSTQSLSFYDALEALDSLSASVEAEHPEIVAEFRNEISSSVQSASRISRSSSTLTDQTSLRNASQTLLDLNANGSRQQEHFETAASRNLRLQFTRRLKTLLQGPRGSRSVLKDQPWAVPNAYPRPEIAVSITKTRTSYESKPRPEPKILLLGNGYSGKSTILKRMISSVAQHQLTAEDSLHDHRELIWDNFWSGWYIFLNQLKARMKSTESLYWTLNSIYPNYRNKKFLEASRLAIDEISKHPESYKLPNNFSYYLSNIHSIHPDYEPTLDDIFRARSRTTGLHKNLLSYQGQDVTIVDVGGERSERRKWIHCFLDTTSIIFVVSLSGYDTHLSENQDVNDLQDALMVWDSIANSLQFVNTCSNIFYD